MQRIGVFVCWCGSNIAATVDVAAVTEALRLEPGVVFAENYQYMCSEAGQNMIKNAIKEHHLTGVVICSCSPRMHEATFRKTATAAGINPYGTGSNGQDFPNADGGYLGACTIYSLITGKSAEGIAVYTTGNQSSVTPENAATLQKIAAELAIK